MKLLFVCQGLPKLSDGSLLIAYELARFLSRRHEVDLIFLEERLEKASPPYFFKNATAVPFKPRKGPFSRLKNIISLKPNLVSLYGSNEMRRKIYRLSQEGRYDIIIAMTMNTAQFVCNLKGVKKILMPHDAEHLIYGQILDEAEGLLSRVKAWLWWKKVCAYQKQVYPFFDRCIVVSERDKEGLLELSSNIKAEVLPSGVDTDFFYPLPAEQKRDALIFTGVMNTWSNVDAVTYFVEDIFPLVQKGIPSIKLFIVGKKPSAAVRKLASRHIIVTGEVDDIRPYLREASVFVAPFRIGTGLKHKLLEAMAMGIPVVSTTLGANGIKARDGEEIILADNAEEFSAACINIHKNIELRERIARNAMLLVKERYNWERIGCAMEDILEDVFRS